MNRKEIREIKKRFQPELENFSHIYGCYVNGAKEVVSFMDLPVMLMEKEEKEMYSSILRKTLSGTLGRNLLNIEFATSQVGASDEHTLLQALRMSALSDEEMRKLFYQRVIESLDMEETSYVILLAADTYDVPHKVQAGEEWDEDSTDQYDYFVCCICPVKDSKAALRYLAEERSFRGASTGSVLANPEAGFLFPAFDDRMTNIYGALYYSRGAADIHEDLVKSIFNAPEVPIAPKAQQNAFSEALSEALGEECSLDVVRSVHGRIKEELLRHKESKDPDAPEISIGDVAEILTETGVSESGIERFQEVCRRNFEERVVLNPANLIESRKFEVVTPEMTVKVDPEHIYEIRTEEIDGRQYLLIPMGEGVSVNGIDIVMEAHRGQHGEDGQDE